MPQEVERDSRAARRSRTARRGVALLLPLFLLTADAASALPGGGGISLDGALVPAVEVWSEYGYLIRVRDMIHPKPAGAVDAAVFKKAADQVLERNVLAREARRRGISLGEQERAGLREKQVAGWKGEANFQTALALLGVTEAFMMRRMELKQLSRKMAELDVEAQGAPSEADLLGFYRGNLKLYRGATSALRYLLLPADWGWKQVAEVAAAAGVLLAEGRDYESLVRRFSVHGSAAAGGVVAESSGGAWPHPGLAGSLKPGRLSRELRDEAGIHLYARDALLPLPFESVQSRVAADLRETRIAADLRSLAERLRQASVVEYLEGTAPAGATAPPPGHQ